jgi:hypothetical protein
MIHLRLSESFWDEGELNLYQMSPSSFKVQNFCMLFKEYICLLHVTDE